MPLKSIIIVHYHILSEFSYNFAARTDADRQVHQAQALWSACSALWASMRTVDTKQPWQKQLRPLKAEVEAVRKASGKIECL